jgi:hypothetical protein
MNLWVNRLRQLLTLAVALFFFSCEEEITFLGFKNPNTKFDTYSVNIPLESTVLLMDSLRTSNNNGFVGNELNRLLVGRYNDPDLGPVASTAVGSYFWLNANKLPADAQLLSAELHLAFDLYFYGPEAPAEQTFTVHEVLDDLSDIARSKYVSKTTVGISDEVVGTLSREINPPLIRELYNPPASTDKPQPDTLKIPLSEDFYSRIWEAARSWSYSNDSTLSFHKPEAFLEAFKGLAIRPGESNNMMIGFSSAPFSQIVLKYQVVSGTTTTKGNLILTFNSGLTSYNNITADFSAGPLAGIQYHTDFLPGNNLRYLQAGTGIVTKLSLDNFLAFADTVGPNIIINDVQLQVGGVQTNTTGMPPPAAFVLRGVKDDNTIWTIPQISSPGSADSVLFHRYRLPPPTSLPLIYLDVASAQRPAYVDGDYGFLMGNDVGSFAQFTYKSSENRYSLESAGSVSLFFQQLYRNREDPQLTRFIMFPTASGTGPSGLKAVNKAVFPADQIRLVVKYTKPTITE